MMTTDVSHARAWRFVLVLAASAMLLCVACDDGGEEPTDQDTTVADTTGGDADDTSVDDTGTEDTGTDDTAEADADDGGDDVDDVDDTADDMADTTDVWTEPARFSLDYLNEDLREIIHLADASSLIISEAQMSARSLDNVPLAGQTLAISTMNGTPDARISPTMPVTDANGLTPTLELTLTGDTSLARTFHEFTPYIVGNTPEPLRNQIRVETQGVDVTATWPEDANGDPVVPVADGTSTWEVTYEIARMDPMNTNTLPDNLELGIEFITNQGTPPLAFADDPTATEMTWPISTDDPTVTVTFVSTGTDPGQARMFVRIYQLGDDHGDRIEMVDVVAAP